MKTLHATLMLLYCSQVSLSQEDILAVTPPAGAVTADEWRPEIPRVWDDEAIATIELPLASAEHSPHHVSSEYYYSLPTRKIYKSYPIYHPDHEPAGYWKWLHEQEPEVVFDAGKLKTKDEWIRAGEIVFTASKEFSTGSELAFVREPAAYEAAGVRLTAEGHFPYARYFVREKGKVEIGTNSCATCHSRVMEDGTLFLGGAGDIPLGSIIGYEIRQMIANLGGEAEPLQDRNSMNYRFAAAPWIDPDPGELALGKSLVELAELHEAWPPGVFGRQRTSFQNPARVPDLVGVADRLFLDATGIALQRSMADLMRYAALNQDVDELASYAGFRPAAEDFETLPAPATLTRYSDEQLYALALYLYSLKPPPNPNPFDDAARRGHELFRSRSCQTCHTPPLYTNNRLVPAPGFEPPEDHRERFGISTRRVGTDPGLTLRTRRGTGYYKIPSLRGVWRRGPFLHDGSLATLEDVFDPLRLDDDYVPTGFRGPGVEQRAVPGHEFGLNLTEAERADLVAFLRTL